MNSVNETYMGIDIGGSMIKWGIIDGQGNIHKRGMLPTEPQLGLDAFMVKLRSLIQGNLSIHGIGISVPGVVNPATGKIVGGIINIPFLSGENLINYLKDFSDNIKIINDVKAAALGEYWVGSGKGYQSLFFVAIGTGIGGCLMLDGKIYDGAHFHAGEIGFMKYRNEDDFLEKKYSAKGLITNAEFKLGYDGLESKEFFNQIRKENPEYCKVFGEWVDSLSSALADVLIMIDPEVLLMGGGITENGKLLLNSIKNAVHRHMPREFAKQHEIKLAECKNDAGVLGTVYNLLNN